MGAARVRKVVIVGGGTAGWMAAAVLSHQFRDLLEITLVESEQIGTIGVGESTIPPIRRLHQLLQIDEREFMQATSASFKLSISFEDWLRPGRQFFHPFGYTGIGTWACEFHQFWLAAQSRGVQAPLADFCMEAVASRERRFLIGAQQDASAGAWSTRIAPVSAPPGRAALTYAYHLDAGLYARFLRRFAEGHGLRRIEGRVGEVVLHPESGWVQSLLLDDGRRIDGDLFIDCSGFRGLLIEQALQTGYEDWTHWLPCDRAVALQTRLEGPAVPYTRAIAHEAGWRWQIPLQHRIGNGWVYSSRHMSDDEARRRLLREASGTPIRDPVVVPFTTGRRRLAWNRNVVAMGLSSGFVEPLESTSIHMVASAAVRLVQMFPMEGIVPEMVARYNAISCHEMEDVRDFIILHYHATARDEGLWRECREMAIPDSLVERIALFRERAYVWQDEDDLFRTDSWLHVMLGQGIVPRQFHPLALALPEAEMRRLFETVRNPIRAAVQAMPSHSEFVRHYCPADASIWAPLESRGLPAGSGVAPGCTTAGKH